MTNILFDLKTRSDTFDAYEMLWCDNASESLRGLRSISRVFESCLDPEQSFENRPASFGPQMT